MADAMVLSGCRINSNLTKNEKLQTQGGTNRPNQGTQQPKRTKGKSDRHWSRCALKSYYAARKIDNGVVGVVQTLRSKEALLLYVEKQREQAKEVVGRGS